MRGKKIITLKIDEFNRVYIYPKKVVFRQKRNGKWMTRFSGISVSDLLESTAIDESVKEKLLKMLKRPSSFFNRG